MNNNNKYIPLLRFPEFQNDGEWELRYLAEILNYEQPGAYIVNDTNYKKMGTPVLTANKGFILGYTDESYGVYNDLPVIIFDDFTTDKKFVNFPFKVKSSAIKLLTLKNKNRDDLKFVFECMKNIKFEEKEHKRYYISTYQNIKILVPKSTQEQKKIADCFVSIDKEIDATKRKLEQLKEHKKGLMQKLFPAKGKTIPELRFPEFQNEGEWGKKQLKDFLVEHKTKSDGKAEVYSVSVSKGVVNQIEYLGRSFSAKDTTNYKLVKPNDIIYTKSPTGAFPFGIIKQSFVKHNVIVSPLYAVFTPINKYIGYIIHSYFESPIRINNYLLPIIQKGAKNTIQISNTTFLSNGVCFPSELKEQRKIAECLSSLDNYIDAIKDKIMVLELHKKGLMQQLFPKL